MLQTLQRMAGKALLWATRGLSSDPGWPTRIPRPPGEKETRLENPWRQSGFVHGAVDMVATNGSAVPFGFYRGRDESSPPLDIELDPNLVAFKTPNPFLGHVCDLWYVTWAGTWMEDLVLWIKQGIGGSRVGNGGQAPTMLWPILGCYVTTVWDKGILVGYRVRTEGGETVFKPYEVIVFRNIDPYNISSGSARMGPVRLAVETDYAAQRWNKSYFESGARPSGVVTTESRVGGDVIDQVRSQFEDQHAGADNAHRVMTLSKGMVWTPNDQSQKDMEFAGLRAMSRDEIIGAAGSNKLLHGFVDTVNRATAEVAEGLMMRYTVRPTAERFARTVTSEIRMWAGMGDVVASFDFTGVESLRPDQLVMTQVAQNLQQMGIPLDTINEMLGLNLPPLEIGAVAFISSALTPVTKESVAAAIDMKVNPPTPIVVAPGGAGKAGDTMSPPPKKGARALETREPVLTFEAEEEIEAPAELRALAQPTEAETRANHGFITSWLALHGELSNAFEKTVTRHFGGMRAVVLAGIGKSATIARSDLRSASDDLAILISHNKDEWDKRLRALAGKHYTEAASRVAEWTAPQIGGLHFFDLGNPALTQAFAEKELRIVGINRTVETALRQQIAEGIANSETIGDIQNRIRSVFNASNARALTIARTETAQASAITREQIALAEGIKRWKWITAGDIHVRPGPNPSPGAANHVRLNGEVRDVGDRFSNGLIQPADPHGAPGEIINCRCIARYMRN